MDLRCYGLVIPKSDGKLTLHLPDIANFTHTWDIEKDLPWEVTLTIRRGETHPPSLDQKLMEAIMERCVPKNATGEMVAARTASIAFLYLYMVLADDSLR